MTKGKQWAREDLSLGTIRTHRDFQFREGGLDTANLNRIVRALEAGGDARDPIAVARVGRVLYVVDGHHRLEAYRRAGRATVPARVAKMQQAEARDYARASNSMNGKGYTRLEKQKIFDDYVAQGDHKDALGRVKPCREISAELGGIYSHETVRKKLRALGVELDEATEFPGGYKPRDSEEGLLADLVEDAEVTLAHLGDILPDLPSGNREVLLGAVRQMVEAFEKGERPDMRVLLPSRHLDI